MRSTAHLLFGVMFFALSVTNSIDWCIGSPKDIQNRMSFLVHLMQDLRIHEIYIFNPEPKHVRCELMIAQSLYNHDIPVYTFHLIEDQIYALFVDIVTYIQTVYRSSIFVIAMFYPIDNEELIQRIEDSARFTNRLTWIFALEFQKLEKFVRAHSTLCKVSFFVTFHRNLTQEVHLVTTQRTDILMWSPLNGFHGNAWKYFYDRRDFHGEELRVGCLDAFPFFLLEDKENGSVIGTGGLDYQLLSTIAMSLNFKFKLVRSPDAQWGKKDNRTWTGLIGMVHRKEVDLALSLLSRTTEREEAVDFTEPYGWDEVTFITRSPTEISRSLAIIRPFHYTVWIGVFMALFTVSATLLLSLRQNEQRNISIYNLIFDLCGRLLLQGGILTLPGYFSIRIITATWSILVILLTATYGGKVTSLFNKPLFDNLPQTTEELDVGITRNQILCLTVDGSSFLTNMLIATTGTFAVIGQQIMKNPEISLVKGVSDGMRRLHDRGRIPALIFAKTVLEGTKAKLGWENYKVASDQFYTTVYAISVPQSSGLKFVVNKRLRQILEAGLNVKWRSELIELLRRSSSTSSFDGLIHERKRRLTIEDLFVAFVILLIGYIIATLSLIGESLPILYLAKYPC